MAMFLAYTSDADQVEYTENQVTGTLINKTIGSNGTYNASSDSADGYSKVVVNVPPPTLTTKNITQNGSYNASGDNADGYSNVTVNVTSGAVAHKNITENGTYNASNDSLDGYSSVTVNVPQSGGASTLIHKDITSNGTYDASSDNADGFSSITVNVSGSGSSDIEMVVNNSYGYTERYITSSYPESYNAYGLTFDISKYLDLYGTRIDTSNFIVQIRGNITISLNSTPDAVTERSANNQTRIDFFKDINRTNKTITVGLMGGTYLPSSTAGMTDEYHYNYKYIGVSIVFVPPES